ncbi:MAG: gliding motility lipoprotein GldH [Robiginitalea sp.]|uniref:gliding motility lipoprotein GldH n=1 Tax=Robiginitalea sp. TaxID=1902411 RepID=UPI003C76258B
MLRSLLIFCGLLLCTSCTEHLAYSTVKSTENGQWQKERVMEFTFSEMDTARTYDMFITLRNDQEYPYNNLFVIAEFTTPGGVSERDTLEYQMADGMGNWLGSGFGSVRENKLWYKENIVFPNTGVYTVTVAHAMRKNGSTDGLETLPGVLDIGLQIEKNP